MRRQGKVGLRAVAALNASLLICVAAAKIRGMADSILVDPTTPLDLTPPIRGSVQFKNDCADKIFGIPSEKTTICVRTFK